MSVGDWFWYAGTNEEWFEIGPCDSKEQAIDEAVDSQIGEFEDLNGNLCQGFYIIEATENDVLLSRYFDVELALESAGERLGEDDMYSECGNEEYFDMTSEQRDDLYKRIKQTIDNWQQEHNLKFSTNMFSRSRHMEYIVLPLED